jgi:hypothetical protein
VPAAIIFGDIERRSSTQAHLSRRLTSIHQLQALCCGRSIMQVRHRWRHVSAVKAGALPRACPRLQLLQRRHLSPAALTPSTYRSLRWNGTKADAGSIEDLCIFFTQRHLPLLGAAAALLGSCLLRRPGPLIR